MTACEACSSCSEEAEVRIVVGILVCCYLAKSKHVVILLIVAAAFLDKHLDIHVCTHLAEHVCVGVWSCISLLRERT